MEIIQGILNLLELIKIERLKKEKLILKTILGVGKIIQFLQMKKPNVIIEFNIGETFFKVDRCLEDIKINHVTVNGEELVGEILSQKSMMI